jgi:hypothetical protein
MDLILIAFDILVYSSRSLLLESYQSLVGDAAAAIRWVRDVRDLGARDGSDNHRRRLT